MEQADFRGRSSEEIEREARRTRERLTETMEEIQARLSPATWQSMFRDGSVVMEIVRRHPVPSLLFGVSALWLAASLARDPLFRPRPRRGVEPLSRDRAPVPASDAALAPPPYRSAPAAPYPEDVTVAAPAGRALDDEVAAHRAAAAGRTGATT